MTWHEDALEEKGKRKSRSRTSSFTNFFRGQAGEEVEDSSMNAASSAVAEKPKVVWVTLNDKIHSHTLRASINVADEKLYNNIVSILVGRDYEKLDKFKRRNRFLHHEAVEALQSLAFLIEYCRSSTNKGGLDRFVLDDASEAQRPSVEFDLRRLNACPKACCRVKMASGDTLSHCPRIGMISCAKCGIATWCSEECLEVGFEQHQEVCRAATDLLNQLGL